MPDMVSYYLPGGLWFHQFHAILKPGGGDPPELVVVVVDKEDAAVSKWTWRATRDLHIYRNFSYRKDGLKRCRRIYLHRYLMGLKPHHRRCVDHLNNNPLENWRANLQPVTRRVNTIRAFRRDGAARAWTEKPLRPRSRASVEATA